MNNELALFLAIMALLVIGVVWSIVRARAGRRRIRDELARRAAERQKQAALNREVA